MCKEDDVRERDQQNLFEQRLAQRVDGVVDQLRAVVKRNDLDARWEARLPDP